MIVLVIALVVFGPKRLPQMGRQLGQALREFKTATAEVRAQVGMDEIADSVKDIKSSFSLTGSDAAAPAAVEAVAPSSEAATAPADRPARHASAPTPGPRPPRSRPPSLSRSWHRRRRRTISAPTPPAALADPPSEAAGPAERGRHRDVRQAQAQLVSGGSYHRRLRPAWSASTNGSPSSSTSTSSAGASSSRRSRWPSGSIAAAVLNDFVFALLLHPLKVLPGERRTRSSRSARPSPSWSASRCGRTWVSSSPHRS